MHIRQTFFHITLIHFLSNTLFFIQVSLYNYYLGLFKTDFMVFLFYSIPQHTKS